MARNAGGRRSGESDGVALVACDRPMRTGQSKARCRIVVERTGFPSHIRVASLAFRRKSRFGMRRIRRCVVIGLVAGGAGG